MANSVLKVFPIAFFKGEDSSGNHKEFYIGLVNVLDFYIANSLVDLQNNCWLKLTTNADEFNNYPLQPFSNKIAKRGRAL